MSRDSILLATNNPDKLEEIRRALGAPPGWIRCPSDFPPPVPDPVEDGATYLENATIKASELSRWAGIPALADDTGLEVDALGGAPGVHTARYAGENATYADNVARMLEALSGRPREERGAVFRTVLVVCDGDEVLYSTEGRCPGFILEEPRGDGGFGYDPIFVPEGHTRTFAEIPPEEKDLISHRGRALAQLTADIQAGRFPLPPGGSDS